MNKNECDFLDKMYYTHTFLIEDSLLGKRRLRLVNVYLRLLLVL